MTKSQFLFNFNVTQLLYFFCVNILSAFNDKLLISSFHISQLFIYSRDGHHISTITIPYNDTLLDAAWTHHGNIVYTTYNNSKVVVMSQVDKVIILYTQMKRPKNLCVLNNVIYIADFFIGIYQSRNGGENRDLVFSKLPDQWFIYLAIKVTTYHSHDFWTLKTITYNDYHLRVYSEIKEHPVSKLMWRELNFTENNGPAIILKYSSLLYDGNRSILLSEWKKKVVHVLSINHCTLLQSSNIKECPCRLAIDKDRQLLYVGQADRMVGVYLFA